MKIVSFTLAAAMLGTVATPALANPAHHPKNPEDVKASEAQRGTPGRKGLSQNGTTVPTADTVKAPKREQRGMLVPAVQSAREAARQPKRKMEQNGTTVSTASEVQASKAQRGLPQESRRSSRRKMSQNGTTVPTASEVKAPGRDE